MGNGDCDSGINTNSLESIGGENSIEARDAYFYKVIAAL